MSNVAFAKIGKSIKFNSKYSPTGGCNESPNLLISLAKTNPNNMYYLIGRSDFKKLTDDDKTSLFPNNNVIDVYENAPKLTDRKDYNSPLFQHINNYFKEKNVKIDYSIMMLGQVGTVTIPGRIKQIKNPELTASVIDMTLNYTTPIVTWLNDNLDIPLIEIINDPRYTLAQSRDIFHLPDVSLSQYNDSYLKKYILSYDNQIPLQQTNINISYSEMEKLFLLNREFPNNYNKTRNTKFTIILNEGSPSRYSLLKNWVLENPSLNIAEIYGKWEHKETENDSRFKGSIQLEEVQQKMEDTKYTFIIPIKKGWVTSKYIEMIYAGCLPFFHPTYDEQRHIDVPEILRPHTMEDLNLAINYFEEHEEDRIKLVKELQEKFIKETDLNGLNISNIIGNSLIK
jgi:hypothetical protein